MVIMFPIPQKYLIEHPFLTPEHYTLFPGQYNSVKCLFVPVQGQPVILSDSYNNIIDEFFASESYLNLYFTNNYHMTISETLQFVNGANNYVATHLYRMYSYQYNQHRMHLSIKGNAFLFGTYRKIQDSYVLDNYSVPYEIVEQAYRLYETGTKTQQIKVH